MTNRDDALRKDFEGVTVKAAVGAGEEWLSAVHRRLLEVGLAALRKILARGAVQRMRGNPGFIQNSWMHRLLGMEIIVMLKARG